MPTEQESFWDGDHFAVITDKTKPAMKMTIDKLISMGKNVYTVDVSDKPDEGTFQKVSELPHDVERAVIGVTTIPPEDMIDILEEKGITNWWIHWRTETPEILERCRQSQVQCISGRCPMMYLGTGLSIHTIHQGIAKLLGKY